MFVFCIVNLDVYNGFCVFFCYNMNFGVIKNGDSVWKYDIVSCFEENKFIFILEM